MSDQAGMHVGLPQTATSAFAGRVPRGLKSTYAIGASAETIIGFAFNSFNFFFYVNILGVPGTLVGLAISIGLFFDAITDPLVGGWSDRTRSRLGRRHPFMFAAPLPLLVALFLIYSPPAGLGHYGLFAWLLCLSLLMRGAMTLFHLPHLALGAELSADFTERTRVMSLNTLVGALGALVTFFVAYRYFFHATPEFKNGLLNHSAYPVFAGVAGLIGCTVMLVSTFGTLRVIPRLTVNPKGQAGFNFTTFVEDCRSALRNRNYLVLLVGYLLLSATLGTRETIALHMNTYYWELLPKQISLFAPFLVVAPFMGFLFAAPLHERFGKKPVIIGSLVGLLMFAAGPVLLRISGLFPANHTPWLLPMLIAFVTTSLSFGAILLISVMSSLADIADEQEITTGRRQEGIFYAARSFFAKASSGLGHLLAGMAIDLIHFPVGATPGTVPAATVFKLGLIDGPIAIIPGGLAIIFYLRFNLTRSRHAEIQAELTARHANSADD